MCSFCLMLSVTVYCCLYYFWSFWPIFGQYRFFSKHFLTPFHVSMTLYQLFLIYFIFSYLWPGISHFSKEPGLLVLGRDLRNQAFTLDVLIAGGNILASKPSQLTEPANLGADTNLCGLPRWLSGKESIGHREDPGLIPRSEESLEEEMAAHSSILAWRILWTEEPSGLLSMESQRVRSNRALPLPLSCVHAHICKRFCLL